MTNQTEKENFLDGYLTKEPKPTGNFFSLKRIYLNEGLAIANNDVGFQSVGEETELSQENVALASSDLRHVIEKERKKKKENDLTRENTIGVQSDDGDLKHVTEKEGMNLTYEKDMLKKPEEVGYSMDEGDLRHIIEKERMDLAYKKENKTEDPKDPNIVEKDRMNYENEKKTEEGSEEEVKDMLGKNLAHLTIVEDIQQENLDCPPDPYAKHDQFLEISCNLEKDPKTTKDSDILEPTNIKEQTPETKEQTPASFSTDEDIEAPIPARKTRMELIKEQLAKKQTHIAKKVGNFSNENISENV